MEKRTSKRTGKPSGDEKDDEGDGMKERRLSSRWKLRKMMKAMELKKEDYYDDGN